MKATSKSRYPKSRRSIPDVPRNIAFDRAGLEQVKISLETLELIARLRRDGDTNRRRLLADLEISVLTHLASVRGGPLTKRLSGAAWVSEFKQSKLTSDLTTTFRASVEAFLVTMKDAHVNVKINTTFRPAERAYLMHYAFEIAKSNLTATAVPGMPGVDIEWVHPTDAASIQAAKDMVAAYEFAKGLKKAPQLHSRHEERRAIDMDIWWSGDIMIKNKNGKTTTIFSAPRDGENKALQKVGATYGVIHATKFTDRPHWSDDGS
jgi:hypothetical protein